MYGRPSKRMRRIKPVARVGAVDVNVRYDIHQCQKLKNGPNGGCPEECYDILEGEVLYRTKSGNFYRDNSIHLLSCTNGLNVRDEIEVCGVAVTGFSPKLDVYEQGFVLQVSGLTTIFNNSDLSINAGDSVYVERPNPDPNYVPKNNPTGVPRSKKLLVLSNRFNDETTLGFLGTCVKGGRSKSSIDIVLHRGRQSQFPFIPDDERSRETKFENQQLNGDLEQLKRAGTESRLPAKKVRKKSSK